MPHPAYISRATLDVEREDLWKSGDDIINAPSSQRDAGAPSADVEGRGDYSYSAGSPGGSGSEASAVNNAPDVHHWLQIRPVWISGIGFDSFPSQPTKHAACSATHRLMLLGPRVTTWSRSSFAGGLTSNCVSDLMHKGHQTKVAHFTFMQRVSLERVFKKMQIW